MRSWRLKSQSPILFTFTMISLITYSLVASDESTYLRLGRAGYRQYASQP